MGIEGMPLALLVNPSSAGGKTLKLLPRVEQALDARRIEFRVQRTHSLEHGVEQALRSDRGGRGPGGDERRRAARRGRRRDGRVPRRRSGSSPAGAATTWPRVLGIPDEPEGAVEVLVAGHTRRIDVGEANGKRFLGIVSVGFDSEANRLANETHFLRGNLVYAYAALRTLLRWKPARFTVRVDDERIRFTGYSVSVANSRAFGGGMYIAPNAELDDGEFDIVTVGEVGKLRFVGNLPKVFKGTHVEEDEVRVFRAPAPGADRQPAVPGLRRRRAPHRPSRLPARPAQGAERPRAAAGRSLSALPSETRPRRPGGLLFGAKRAAARAIGAASRASGRGGGTTLPGRVLLRLDPEAIARLGAKLDRGTTIVSATNGKTTTAGMIAALLAADGRRAGPQPGRFEHDLGSRHGAARAGWARRACSRSTRPGCRGSSSSSTPR